MGLNQIKIAALAVRIPDTSAVEELATERTDVGNADDAGDDTV